MEFITDKSFNNTLGKSVRHLWHLDPNCTYLNHGSFGATPKVVLAAQQTWQHRLETQPVKFMSVDLAIAIRQSAAVLADFVGAKPDSLVFVENATAGINTVLRSLDFKVGDVILTTNHGYAAVNNAIKYTCKRYNLRQIEAQIPFPIDNQDQVLAAIIEASKLSNPDKIKLLVIDHITSASALIFPIEQIINWAHSEGILVLVDGAHAPGGIPLNLDQLGADWYAGNCHKWLFAAKGCGFLATLPQHQSSLHPLVISHGYGLGYLAEFDWVGTRDFSSWLSIDQAITFHQSFDQSSDQRFNLDFTNNEKDFLFQHNHQLAIAAAQLLADSWGQSIPAPQHMLSTMVSIPISTNLDSESLHNLLWQKYQIEVPIIPFCDRLWLRISAQVYNQLSEYEYLAESFWAIAKHIV
jgi:isopenicillin-N epimerase